MSQSPIGALMVEAGKHAQKKANGHTSVAPCGCEVTVAAFGSSSQRIAPEPCAEHREKSTPEAPSKRARQRAEVEA